MFKYFLLSSLFAFGFATVADAACSATYQTNYAAVSSSDPNIKRYPGAIAYEYKGFGPGKLDEWHFNSDGVKLRIYQNWVYANTFFYLYFPFSDEDGSKYLKNDHLTLNPEQLGFDIKSYMSPYLVPGAPQPSSLSWTPVSFSCVKNLYWVDFFSNSFSPSNNLFGFSIFKRPRTGCYAIRAVLLFRVSSLFYADASFSWANKSLLSFPSLKSSSYYSNSASYYPNDIYASLVIPTAPSSFSSSLGFSLEALDFGYQLAFRRSFTSFLPETYSDPFDNNNVSPLSVDDENYKQAYSLSLWTNPQCFWQSSPTGNFYDRFLSFLRGFF